MILNKLPEGIFYVGQDIPGHAKKQLPSNFETATEGDIVKIGKFLINVEIISKQQLMSLRKFLPSEEYRLLKNRISARISRRKKKVEV